MAVLETSVVVNKSGKSIPVYAETEGGPRTKIGTLYNREAYILCHGYEGDGFSVWFRNSSGVMTHGYIDSSIGNAVNESFSKYIEKYPYNSVSRQMYCRSAKKIYSTAGGSSTIATVGAGKCVKLYNSSVTGGASEAYMRYINGYNNPPKIYLRISQYMGSNGKWITANGYIDLSLEYASGYNTIQVYGSW